MKQGRINAPKKQDVRNVIDAHTDLKNWVACPSCDQLYDLSSIRDGEKAHCSRCKHFLSSYRSEAYTHVQAYALAALVFLAIACSFPFLTFRTRGIESVMTLPETVMQLYIEGQPYLAVLVSAFIIVIPTLILMLILALSYALGSRRPYRWLTGAGRIIFTLNNWSMVEVFFIGVLVSLVKIAKMATIIVGTSFWGYAAFCICFTLAMANLDRFQSWKLIEELRQ